MARVWHLQVAKNTLREVVEAATIGPRPGPQGAGPAPGFLSGFGGFAAPEPHQGDFDVTLTHSTMWLTVPVSHGNIKPYGCAKFYSA